MAEKKNTFQIGLLVVFGLAIFIAVLLFSLSKAQGNKGISSVVVWGTFPQSTFTNSLEALNNKDDETGVKISYQQKNPATYNSELVEAFASGTGPDLFFVNQEMLLSFENKIQEVSYDSLPERDFNLRYVDGARVFLSDTGMRAFPFASDPLVMYYNKSILNTAGIVTPPTLWSQFIGLVPELTTLDSNQNILKSGLAFGQFNNIPYATNLMEAFLLQLGTPIITKDISGQYISVIDTSSVRETKPLSTSLQFFTLFADPLKETYSWNSVMPSAEDMFVQDRLALYFAPASKFLDIQRKNINLNYDITKLPQVSVTSNFVTSADFYGVAISKNSKVLSGAFVAANLLSNGEYNKTILEANFLAPVRRDLLSGAREQDPYKAAVRESALIAQTWQNPDSRGFSSIISNGVDDIIKGILSPGMASLRIQGEMTVLINSLKR